MEIPYNQILNIDALEGLKTLPDESVNCIITSPPYWGLRDYGVNGQVGLEDTPESYIKNMVLIFREAKRVLSKDGTCWINIGDTYWGGKGTSGSSSKETQNKRYNKSKSITPGTSQVGGKGQTRPQDKKHTSIKPKDLVGIPWMLAFALREDGWYLRQDIIWQKPNCMPESVNDRCTKNHEYIFLLSKSRKYYFDQEAILQEASPHTHARVSKDAMKKSKIDDVVRQKGSLSPQSGERKKRTPRPNIDNKGGNQGTGGIPITRKNQPTGSGNKNNPSFDAALINVVTKVNKRSVWSVPTKGVKEAHFATYPENLIKDCVLAGCPENVCSSCGAPVKRIVEKKRIRRDELPKDDPRYRPARYEGSYSEINGKSDAGYSETKTLGWEKSCDCNEDLVPGVVYDPFMGSGTTAIVARKLNRNFIGTELNSDYIKIANNRLDKELGLFK